MLQGRETTDHEIRRAVSDFGKAEISDLKMRGGTASAKKVIGLQVAMNYTDGMQEVQAIEDIPSEAPSLTFRLRKVSGSSTVRKKDRTKSCFALAYPLLQCTSLHVLHH